MHRVRHGFVWVITAVVMGGASLPRIGFAQTAQTQPATPQTTLVLPHGPLLPPKLGPWTRNGQPTEGNDVANAGLPGADVLKEDGATRFATASYQNAGSTVQMRAVEFTDASGAYSAFTFLASQKGRSAALRPGGEESLLPSQGLLLRRSATVVLLSGAPDASLQAAAKQLEPLLPKIYGPKGQPPLVPTLLPSRELVTGSIRYALGPQSYSAMGGLLPPETMGFDKSAEVATADYNVRGAKATLAVILYPTPQIAAQQGRVIEAAANAERAKFGATLKMRRDATLVAIGWGDLSGAAADALIKSANLHEDFTWNQALQAPQDVNVAVHSTASLLANILFFCIVAGSGTILLGIFLGFGRAGVRVMMGKPASTDPEFLSIELRTIPPGVLGHTETPPEPSPPPPADQG